MIMSLIVLVFTIAFAVSPLWVTDFGGFEANQFPFPQIDPPVQPAGYAFAIWGVIYIWLFVGSLFSVWKRRYTSSWSAMRKPLAISMAVGAVWLPVAVLSPVYATILIWIMLATALWALLLCPLEDKWAAAWPLGLYAGWLSAASFVALGLLLGGYGWSSNNVAAWMMICVAAVLTFSVQWKLKQIPTYGCAVIWAFVAIAAQNGFGGSGTSALALSGAALVAWPTMLSALEI